MPSAAFLSSNRLRHMCLFLLIVAVLITTVHYLFFAVRGNKPPIKKWFQYFRDADLLRSKLPVVDGTNRDNGACDYTIFRCVGKDPKGVAITVRHPVKVEFVHQSWKTAVLPSRFKKWSDSWKLCFPKARYILWTDEDNKAFVAKHYPWFLSRYNSLPANIYRADAVRYLYLFHFGGIYTDLDNECLRPFDNLLLNSSLVFGAMQGYKNVKEGYVQNSFMYSEPRHPLWLELVHRIMVTKNGVAPEILTGPDALVKVINEYRKRMNESDDVTVYPPVYFNPFSWQTNKIKACKHFNHMTDKETVECRNAFLNTSYVVQYHTHTWGGGKILRRLL